MSETQDSPFPSLDDLTDCGWQTALSNVNGSGYSAMHHAFFAAANEDDDAERDSHRDALRFLGGICGMMLSANDQNQAFDAMVALRDRRSMISSDLSERQLKVLAGFLPSVENPWLKGRLAHLVWLCSQPRDVSFALMAIDCYRSLPLDFPAWLRGGHAAWAQAIMLSKSLRPAAGSRLQGIERNLVDAALAPRLGKESLLLPISHLLKEHGLGTAHARDIACHLSICASDISEDMDYLSAAASYQQAGAWYHIAHDIDNQTVMIAAAAESYAAEAQRRLHSDSPSALAAASWFEEAIQAYRTIPGSERLRLGVHARIEELRSLLSGTRRQTVTELKTLETTTDVSEVVTRVQDELRGREFPSALKRLAAMVPTPAYEQMRKAAASISERTLYTKIANVSHMSSDGRVVGRRPHSQGDNVSVEEAELTDAAFRHYQQTLEFCGVCVIDPGRSVVSGEHEPTEQYFIALATAAPLVPPGRGIHFGKGLYAGFVGDYISAAHLLIPQLEHLVRHELACAGVHATSLYPSGVERHKTLDTLLAFSEAEAVFGKDLLETLKALLCDPIGEGLRNQFAHGLIDDADFPEATVAFLWGLTLSLTVKSLVVEDIPIHDVPQTDDTLT